MIAPNINESENDFLVRLKQETDYTWSYISDLLNSYYGHNYKSDSYRKRYYKIVDGDIQNTSTYDEIIDQKKNSDERTELNAKYRALAREDTIKEIAHDYASIMNKEKKLNPKPRVTLDWIQNNQDKAGILLISDWHYGIEIDNFYNVYNPEITKDRVSNLRDEVIYIINKENLSQITIVNLGDMIAGNIHLPLRLQSRQDVISQVMEVSELIAELINELSEFCMVDYYSVLDNHSRIDPNKKESIQLESLCRITDWYLKERLNRAEITIHDNEYGPDIADFNVLGFDVLATHGDKDKPNNIISKLSLYTQNHFDLICSAHYHHFSYSEDNDTIVIGNGSLMGTDQFAHDLRLNNKPSQTFIVVSRDNIVDSIHKINV